MRVTSYLLFISPLLLSFGDAAPLPSNFERRDLSAPASGSAILVPVDPTRLATSVKHVPRNMQRRAPKKKLSPEEKERIKEEQLAARGKSKDEVKARRDEELAKRKAEKESVAQEKTRKEKEAKEQEALMTEEQKAEKAAKLEEERERGRQANKDQEEAKKNPGPVVNTLSPKDYDDFWKEFSRPKKGLDGQGLVNVDDITEAFKRCMEADKFLFWSGDKPFQNALKSYERKTGMMRISTAVATPECKRADLGPMSGRDIHKEFRKWVINRAEEQERRDPNSKKKGKATIQPKLSDTMKSVIEYDYYWPNMSTGYARAAKGEVVYIRVDRTPEEGDADRIGSHWQRYERPAIRKRYPGEVTKVREVTFPRDVSDMENTQPTVDREIKP